MGSEVRLFKNEEWLSRSEATAFLRQMADKIDGGEVILRRGTEELTLSLPQNVVLEIQVEDEDKGRKGMQHSLEVEIKWFDDEDGAGPLELG
jgi:amphi-Trp domain-containing protein